MSDDEWTVDSALAVAADYADIAAKALRGEVREEHRELLANLYELSARMLRGEYSAEILTEIDASLRKFVPC